MDVNGTTIHVEKGDLTLTEVDAIVFYASEDLKLGTGFGNAIAMRGGPGIQEELNGMGLLPATRAVASGAGELPATHIIHANGPRFQEPDIPAKLRTTVLNTLAVAEKKGVSSIAFPPMGTGFYGIPLPLCAETMLAAFIEKAQQGTTIREIRIVVMNAREYAPFAERLQQVDEEVAA